MERIGLSSYLAASPQWFRDGDLLSLEQAGVAEANAAAHDLRADFRVGEDTKAARNDGESGATRPGSEWCSHRRIDSNMSIESIELAMCTGVAPAIAQQCYALVQAAVGRHGPSHIDQSAVTHTPVQEYRGQAQNQAQGRPNWIHLGLSGCNVQTALATAGNVRLYSPFLRLLFPSFSSLCACIR